MKSRQAEYLKALTKRIHEEAQKQGMLPQSSQSETTSSTGPAIPVRIDAEEEDSMMVDSKSETRRRTVITRGQGQRKPTLEANKKNKLKKNVQEVDQPRNTRPLKRKKAVRITDATSSCYEDSISSSTSSNVVHLQLPKPEDLPVAVFQPALSSSKDITSKNESRTSEESLVAPVSISVESTADESNEESVSLSGSEDSSAVTSEKRGISSIRKHYTKYREAFATLMTNPKFSKAVTAAVASFHSLRTTLKTIDDVEVFGTLSDLLIRLITVHLCGYVRPNFKKLPSWVLEAIKSSSGSNVKRIFTYSTVFCALRALYVLLMPKCRTSWYSLQLEVDFFKIMSAAAMEKKYPMTVTLNDWQEKCSVSMSLKSDTYLDVLPWVNERKHKRKFLDVFVSTLFNLPVKNISDSENSPVVLPESDILDLFIKSVATGQFKHLLGDSSATAVEVRVMNTLMIKLPPSLRPALDKTIIPELDWPSTALITMLKCAHKVVSPRTFVASSSQTAEGPILKRIKEIKFNQDEQS